MDKKSINPLLLIGFIGSLTIGSAFISNIVEVFYGNKDIYWTHKSMKLPIDETKESFQLFIAEKPLQKHLADQSLLLLEPDGSQHQIVSKDISARLNNWNKVRSKKLIIAIFTGIAFGINLTLLVVGAVQVLTSKGKKSNR